MFTFGWLTITADDLAIWQQFPNAAFTLVQTLASAGEAGDEFRLGSFLAPKFLAPKFQAPRPSE